METRKMNWASRCPVTRRDHEWISIGTMGQPMEATCTMCRAEWVGVEREWELYERDIKEYYYSKELGGWARFDRVE